jgi:hypothetical protein
MVGLLSEGRRTLLLRWQNYIPFHIIVQYIWRTSFLRAFSSAI